MADWLSPARRLKAKLHRAAGHVPASADYVVLEGVVDSGPDAWSETVVARRQDDAYKDLLLEMHDGRPRVDLVAAADAIRLTKIASPSVLEVGCGSGYYWEVLEHLLEAPVNYCGLDSSGAMIKLASERYPKGRFLLGDATRLPFAAASFDIVLNGGSLMHIVRYHDAIRESRRVARFWCVFHTVPLLERRETTFLRKKAYGRETVEVIFNATELTSLLQGAGLRIRTQLDSVPYNLSDLLGEATSSRTYLCEVAD